MHSLSRNREPSAGGEPRVPQTFGRQYHLFLLTGNVERLLLHVGCQAWDAGTRSGGMRGSHRRARCAREDATEALVAHRRRLLRAEGVRCARRGGRSLRADYEIVTWWRGGSMGCTLRSPRYEGRLGPARNEMVMRGAARNDITSARNVEYEAVSSY